jgi:hypothetical protein
MPVRKFRHVAEMERGVWYDRGDPRRFEAIRAAWELARRTLKPEFPPGVYRFRSVEDAEEHREQWERRSFESLQRRRHQR